VRLMSTHQHLISLYHLVGCSLCPRVSWSRRLDEGQCAQLLNSPENTKQGWPALCAHVHSTMQFTKTAN
jgi:hypothetical protein